MPINAVLACDCLNCTAEIRGDTRASLLWDATFAAPANRRWEVACIAGRTLVRCPACVAADQWPHARVEPACVAAGESRSNYWIDGDENGVSEPTPTAVEDGDSQ